MKDGKTSNDLEKFLNKLGEQYIPDNPEAKAGIGHDVEHVKGVMNRSDEIADIINNNPDGDFSRYKPFTDTYRPTREDVMIVLGDTALNYFNDERDTKRKGEACT